MYCRSFGKVFLRGVWIFSLIFLCACTVNPATGQKQFTALMSPDQEQAIGAKEHSKIIQQYGGVYGDAKLQSYVNEIGQKVARNTERADVTYKFTLLNSPVINAFALPGGYVYITRGLLAVANDEAELAAVLGHEIGHVTARHQAERYSQGVLTSLGASVVSAAVGNAGVNQALDIGTNLYMSSYSRDQESQADQLGVRYVSRAGYDPFAMSDFLKAMEGYLSTEGRVTGKGEQSFSYFSSHPDTAERVGAAGAEAAHYDPSNNRGADRYLGMVRGLAYGDGWDQGFVDGTQFYHPKLGFTFSVPESYEISNQPTQIIASGRDGALMIVDMVSNKGVQDPASYIRGPWLGVRAGTQPDSITINGMPAATSGFDAYLAGRPVTIRAIAVAWSPREMVRFKIAIPAGASAKTVDGLKRATYSFHRMSAGEKTNIRAQHIDVVTARVGDTVAGLAARMVVDKAPNERFRALNALGPTESTVVGRRYKIVAE